jgi:hypothetical protein
MYSLFERARNDFRFFRKLVFRVVDQEVHNRITKLERDQIDWDMHDLLGD